MPALAVGDTHGGTDGAGDFTRPLKIRQHDCTMPTICKRLGRSISPGLTIRNHHKPFILSSPKVFGYRLRFIFDSWSKLVDRATVNVDCAGPLSSMRFNTIHAGAACSRLLVNGDEARLANRR